MATTANPQIAIDERVIEDSALEKVLEDREIAKGAAGEARAKLKTLDDLAKGKIEDLGMNGEVVRCGRFRIAKKAVASRHVEFDTDPTSRVSIKPDKVED